MAKNTATKSVMSMFDVLEEKKTDIVPVKEPAKAEKAPVKESKKSDAVVPKEEKRMQRTKAAVNPPQPNKHAKGGRPNTRGEMNVDCKRISLIVPADMYEKIKDRCRGNMTKFICDLIREKIGD